MTREEALKQVNEWYVGTISEYAHWKLINKIYDDFELQIKELKGARNLSIIYIKELEQHLSNIKHKCEMQEIMIADYKKRIKELEQQTCNGCKWYRNYGGVCVNINCPLCGDFVSPNFECIYYEPKDKQ